VVLENESGYWRPGMFAVAELILERAEVRSAVPKSAIHSLGGGTVVFIVDGEGFRPRVVQVGLRDERNVEVRGGIDPGEEVVVVGGFTVKSELMRKHLADGHGR
jgi:cobalt-zinc-cadmium efflux system membrane fusion protein